MTLHTVHVQLHSETCFTSIRLYHNPYPSLYNTTGFTLVSGLFSGRLLAVAMSRFWRPSSGGRQCALERQHIAKRCNLQRDLNRLLGLFFRPGRLCLALLPRSPLVSDHQDPTLRLRIRASWRSFSRAPEKARPVTRALADAVQREERRRPREPVQRHIARVEVQPREVGGAHAYHRCRPLR